MITIERLGVDKIKLTGWIGPQTPDLCKSVGGGRFNKDDPTDKHWRYPLSMTVCRRMREVFGTKLVIGKELNAWARKAKQAEAAVVALKDATTVTFTRLALDAPALDAAAHLYQRAGIAFGAALPAYLLADQPGLGKTMQTIGSIIEASPPWRDGQWLGDKFVTTNRSRYFHLILAPKIAVETVWPAEVLKWTQGGVSVFPLVGTRQKRENALSAALACFSPHVFIAANIEMVRDRSWGLHEIPWETVVVDESHRALIRKSVKTESQQRKGITSLKARRRIALSGTPMRGKPEQLWGTLNWLRPDIYSSAWAFYGRYWEIGADEHSSHVLQGLKPGAEERLARDLAPIMLRRTKGEVLKELPPKTYAGSHLDPRDPDSPFGVWLTPSAKHRKQYEDFLKTDTIEANGQEIEAIGTLAQYTRRSQLSSAIHTIVGGQLMPTADSVKFDWLMEKIEELGDGRIVVASQFTKMINVFAAGLKVNGIPCHVLTGETNAKERARIIADFQSDAPTARVFFLNTKAGGVAVTLDMADDLVLLDESPVPDDQEQVEDRVHRASRMHNVTIHYLRTLGTQDEEIAWIAAARESVQKYVLDGARGVDYAKALYYTKKESASA